MHHGMRTASFAMVFVATCLHLAGKNYSLAAWLFLATLFLVYPQFQFWRALRAPDSIKAEMSNLLVDSVLLGIFIAVVEFSDWLSVSVVLGTLSNNAANKGWRGIRESLVALAAGILVGMAIGGIHFAPHTEWPATLFCIVGLTGYLLKMNSIGFARNIELRRVRETLEAREKELLGTNQNLLESLLEIDALQERLREQASRDALTGLYNRGYLDATLERELARCQREGKPLALIMVDVDHFKKYNDRYGHQAGDACLKTLAHTLQSSAKRASDLAARYGGEEFLLVLADTDSATASRLGEELRRDVEALAIAHQDAGAGRITISVGVAVTTGEAPVEGAGLLRAADDALYRAKHDGRNCVRIAPHIPQPGEAGEDLATNLVQLVWHSAYRCGQPVIDEQHRELFGNGNRLLAAILSRRPRSEVAVLIDVLMRDVDRHFRDEETIIAAAGFPGAAEHAAIHRQLLDRAEDLIRRFQAEELGAGELFGFLAHDLVARHMLGADREFVRYLGAPPGGST